MVKCFGWFLITLIKIIIVYSYFKVYLCYTVPTRGGISLGKGCLIIILSACVWLLSFSLFYLISVSIYYSYFLSTYFILVLNVIYFIFFYSMKITSLDVSNANLSFWVYVVFNIVDFWCWSQSHQWIIFFKLFYTLLCYRASSFTGISHK